MIVNVPGYAQGLRPTECGLTAGSPPNDGWSPRSLPLNSLKTSSRKVSVLVVDDSLFMRTLISDFLRSDPEIATVTTANSGSEAIRKIAEVRPDCVILDLMMPGLDGLMTLKIIMATCPTPVIVLSAQNPKGTDITFRCRAAGAVSFIPKPSGEMCLDIATIHARLLQEVKNVARIRSADSRHQEARRDDFSCFGTAALKDQASAGECEVIVAGGSTGGQLTFEEILGELPARISIPFLMVQHSPSRFLSEQFARRLNRNCALPAKVAENNEPLHGGMVYVAPGGSVLTIGVPLSMHARDVSALKRHAKSSCFNVRTFPDNTLTPSIDSAMQSAANVFGAGVIGVLLSGIGEDGVEGMRAIKAAGGRTIVQDQSAIAFGMPKAVIDAGLADEIMPAQQIARAIEGAVCS